MGGRGRGRAWGGGREAGQAWALPGQPRRPGSRWPAGEWSPERGGEPSAAASSAAVCPAPHLCQAETLAGGAQSSSCHMWSRAALCQGPVHPRTCAIGAQRPALSRARSPGAAAGPWDGASPGRQPPPQLISQCVLLASWPRTPSGDEAAPGRGRLTSPPAGLGSPGAQRIWGESPLCPAGPRTRLLELSSAPQPPGWRRAGALHSGGKRQDSWGTARHGPEAAQAETRPPRPGWGPAQAAPRPASCVEVPGQPCCPPLCSRRCPACGEWQRWWPESEPDQPSGSPPVPWVPGTPPVQHSQLSLRPRSKMCVCVCVCVCVPQPVTPQVQTWLVASRRVGSWVDRGRWRGQVGV